MNIYVKSVDPQYLWIPFPEEVDPSEFINGVKPVVNYGPDHHLWGKPRDPEIVKKIAKSNTGKKRSEEVVRQMSETAKALGWVGDKNPNSKKVIVDGVLYNTCMDVAKEFGICKASVHYRIRSKNFDWDYA